jgi:hypothetical protein
MAARDRKYQTDKTRQKIQATRLMNRYQAFALGEKDPSTGKIVEMTEGQRKAMSDLIGKVVPDVKAIEQTNINPNEGMNEQDLIAEFAKVLGISVEQAVTMLGNMETAKKGSLESIN